MGMSEIRVPENRISDKSLKWWADNGRDLEIRWMARELQQSRERIARVEAESERLKGENARLWGSDEAAKELTEQTKVLREALARLEWQPITPEHLPKIGDEVLRNRLGVSGEPWKSVESVVSNDDLNAQEWLAYKYTHFRPLNLPALNSGERP